MLKDKLSLAIFSCEKYSDLWTPHFSLMEKNWKDNNLDCILITDRPTNRTFDNVKVVDVDGEFTVRVSKCVEKLKTEFVLITLDDYFPVYPIDSAKLERLVDIMISENLDYIRMFSDPNSHNKYKNHKGLYSITLDRNYEVNLYPGIWRKSFLEKTVAKEGIMNIWQYEVSLTETARKCNARCLLSKGKEFRILDVIRKGKLLHHAKIVLSREGIHLSGRDILPMKEEIRLFIFSTGKKILPQKIGVKVKKELNSHGIIFYSNGL